MTATNIEDQAWKVGEKWTFYFQKLAYIPVSYETQSKFTKQSRQEKYFPDIPEKKSFSRFLVFLFLPFLTVFPFTSSLPLLSLKCHRRWHSYYYYIEHRKHIKQTTFNFITAVFFYCATFSNESKLKMFFTIQNSVVEAKLLAQQRINAATARVVRY